MKDLKHADSLCSGLQYEDPCKMRIVINEDDKVAKTRTRGDLTRALYLSKPHKTEIGSASQLYIEKRPDDTCRVDMPYSEETSNKYSE